MVHLRQTGIMTQLQDWAHIFLVSISGNLMQNFNLLETLMENLNLILFSNGSHIDINP